MSRCRHAREGIVSTHPPGVIPDRGEGHAACNSCTRAECIAASKAWAEKVAKRPAEFYPDPRPLGITDPGTPREERLARYAKEAHRG